MHETIEIERLSYGSAAIGHAADGKTVFVEDAVPGDTAVIEFTEDKPNYRKGRLVEVTEASPDRVAPPCPHSMVCGGCTWQHIAYDAQLEAKRSNIASALVRTARFEPARAVEAVRPCRPSKRETGFRNKLELATGTDAGGRFILGFHEAASDEIVTPATCLAAHKPIQKAPLALQGALRYAQGNDDLGIFRVGVRHSLRTKDLEVALWTKPGPFPRSAVAKVLRSALPATSVVRVIADEGKARKVKNVEALSGKGFWEEELSGFRYLTSAPSFFQVNTQQAETLVACALEALAVSPGMAVADLYAGGGTFSLPLADAGADVYAIEAAGSSVRDLRRNAEANGVDVEVIGGDTARELRSLGDLDALLVDPPRAGLAKGVAQDIALAQPERIAYISCDPATWARDVVRFAEVGYELDTVQPVDMFPHTYHVEIASVFSRRR